MGDADWGLKHPLRGSAIQPIRSAPYLSNAVGRGWMLLAYCCSEIFILYYLQGTPARPGLVDVPSLMGKSMCIKKERGIKAI